MHVRFDTVYLSKTFKFSCFLWHVKCCCTILFGGLSAFWIVCFTIRMGRIFNLYSEFLIFERFPAIRFENLQLYKCMSLDYFPPCPLLQNKSRPISLSDLAVKKRLQPILTVNWYYVEGSLVSIARFLVVFG